MGQGIKNVIARFLEHTGTLRLLIAWLHRCPNGASILQYHRIREESSPFEPALHPVHFYQQMAFVARHFEVVPLEELVDDLQHGRPLQGKIALTFDDGYRDFYRIAFPILRRLKLPATVFLTTGFIGAPPACSLADRDDLPWYNRIARILWQTRKKHVTFSVEGHLWDLPLATRSQRLRALQRLKYWLGKMPATRREAVIGYLAEEMGVEWDGRDLSNRGGPSMLSWAEVQEMASVGIRFGAHTHTHPVLSGIPKEEALKEIWLSKQQIEEKIGQEVKIFCYPFGKSKDYSPDLENHLREMGFVAACTSQIGHVLPGDNPFALRRLYTTEPCLAKFAIHLVR